MLTSLDPAAVAHGADIPDAVTIDGMTLSRSDLVGGGTAVAERIAGASRVAVLAAPTVETILSVVGAIIAGVTIVPVPPDAADEEIAHIVTDSRAQAWLGPAPENPALPVVPVRRFARSWHRLPAPAPASAALIVYTSGTTGRPKGVVLSRAALAAGLDALADAWAWTANDLLAHGLPLFHVHGLVLGVLGPLRVGSPLVHTGKPTPAAYADAEASMYFGVPTVWTRIAADESAARRLTGARLLISGSAPLPTTVFDRLVELTGHRPIERYGMTETLITLSTRHDGQRRPGWVGTPVAGVETRLRDDTGSPVEHDGESIGSLEIRGATLFDGYLGNVDATRSASTEDGWFRTGDAAVIDPQGNHRIVGRESVDLIKSGGYRVGAGEIESVLLDHPAVVEVAVVGLPDDDLGQRIVAFVVTGTVVVEDSDLLEFTARRLSKHKCPREIRLVTELPRNAMGKVQKARLG